MNRSQNRPSPSHWQSGAVMFALAAPFAASFTIGRLSQGGLASLALAGTGAVCMGIPLAVAEGRLLSARSSVFDRFLAGVERMWASLWVGSVAAIAMPERSPAWIAAATGVALILPLAGERFPVLPLALAVLAGLCGLTQVLLFGAPWTLLEPAWAAGGSWAAESLAQGFVLAAAGLGMWKHQLTAPGTRRAPWFTVGAALLTGVASAAGLAASFEHGGQLSIAAAFATAAGFAALGSRPKDATLAPGLLKARFYPSTSAVLSTLWFTTLGFVSLRWWFASFLVIGPIAAATRIARATSGNLRWLYISIGSAAAALATVAWPGAPPTMEAALGIATLVVVTVWVAGTPALTNPPAERSPPWPMPRQSPPESTR